MVCCIDLYIQVISPQKFDKIVRIAPTKESRKSIRDKAAMDIRPLSEGIALQGREWRRW